MKWLNTYENKIDDESSFGFDTMVTAHAHVVTIPWLRFKGLTTIW